MHVFFPPQVFHEFYCCKILFYEMTNSTVMIPLHNGIFFKHTGSVISVDFMEYASLVCTNEKRRQSVKLAHHHEWT